MQKESLIFITATAEGVLFVGFILASLVLYLLISAAGEEQNPQQKAVVKFARREKQLKEKEETLKHIERQLKTLK
jgi:large-conductance mechanosensitive channel